MTNASNKCVNYLRNIRDEQACLCMSCKWLLWASGRLLCFDSIQKLDLYNWMALYNPTPRNALFVGPFVRNVFYPI